MRKRCCKYILHIAENILSKIKYRTKINYGNHPIKQYLHSILLKVLFGDDWLLIKVEARHHFLFYRASLLKKSKILSPRNICLTTCLSINFIYESANNFKLILLT